MREVTATCWEGPEHGKQWTIVGDCMTVRVRGGGETIYSYSRIATDGGHALYLLEGSSLPTGTYRIDIAHHDRTPKEWQLADEQAYIVKAMNKLPTPPPPWAWIRTRSERRNEDGKQTEVRIDFKLGVRREAEADQAKEAI